MEQKQLLSVKHKFNLTTLYKWKNFQNLHSPIVLHIPVLDSSYKNSVVSQATMLYSVTPATSICLEKKLTH